MSQSLSKLVVHIICHTKNNQDIIKYGIKAELYSYIGSIIKDNESIPIIINGTENHIHILCVISKNISLSKLVEQIKKHSSRWIKTKDIIYNNFSWQNGYGAFSVSPTAIENVKNYIFNQEEHHKKFIFKDEYLKLLEEHDINFNVEYLWTN